MPIGFFNENDLDQISPITFKQFNAACQLIDPEERDGDLLSAYAIGIEHITNNFKYPHYYNGLIALLLLFSHDGSYDLIDPCRIKHILQETKELAVTGYEDFDDVGITSLNKLISTLGSMADVFRTQYHHYKPMVVQNKSDKTTNRLDLDCFASKNGITTQIKAVDYSMLKEDDLRSDTPQLLPLRSFHALDEEGYLRDLMREFQKAYISVTSGLVLSTIIGNQDFFTTSVSITCS